MNPPENASQRSDFGKRKFVDLLAIDFENEEIFMYSNGLLFGKRIR